jgi:hypothetical protein
MVNATREIVGAISVIPIDEEPGSQLWAKEVQITDRKERVRSSGLQELAEIAQEQLNRLGIKSSATKTKRH